MASLQLLLSPSRVLFCDMSSCPSCSLLFRDLELGSLWFSLAGLFSLMIRTIRLSAYMYAQVNATPRLAHLIPSSTAILSNTQSRVNKIDTSIADGIRGPLGSRIYRNCASRWYCLAARRKAQEANMRSPRRRAPDGRVLPKYRRPWSRRTATAAYLEADERRWNHL